MPTKSKTTCGITGIPESLIHADIAEWQGKHPRRSRAASKSVAIPAPPQQGTAKYAKCINTWSLLYSELKSLDGLLQQQTLLTQQQALLSQQIKAKQMKAATLQQSYATCMGGYSV